MTRIRKIKPEDRAHLVYTDDNLVCSLCGEVYKPRKHIRFHRHKWMSRHVACKDKHGEEES